MELIQLSTTWCAPCRMAKEYIESNFDPAYINYKFILLNDNTIEQKYLDIITTLRPRSVPLFVVTEGSEIIYTFSGFNLDEINKYTDYITRQKTDKIITSIPIEEAEKKDNIYDDISDEFESKHAKLNGQYHEDDLDDLIDYVDDQDDQDDIFDFDPDFDDDLENVDED